MPLFSSEDPIGLVKRFEIGEYNCNLLPLIYTKVKDWINNSEPVLIYDGSHPQAFLSEDVFDTPERRGKIIGDWQYDPFYSKIINNEPCGSMWLNQTGQALPRIPFFHNQVNI